MKHNTLQNKDEEDMTTYTFMEISGIEEFASVFEITAGCEDDAWELANESQESNFSNIIMLTPKLIKDLKKAVKELK